MSDLTNLELVFVGGYVIGIALSPPLWMLLFMLWQLKRDFSKLLIHQSSLFVKFNELSNRVEFIVILLKGTLDEKVKPTDRSSLVVDELPDNIKEKIVAIWPTAINYPPLALFNDFTEFVNNLARWELIALVGNVPVSKLTDTFRRFIRNKEQVTIFYAATHGSSKGILLTDGWLAPKNLAQLLSSGKVKLAILMTCESTEMASALRRHGIDAVIYIEGKIEDKKAIKIMKSVMQSLADGLTVAESVDLAKTELDILTAHASLRATFSHDFRVSDYE